MNDDKFVGGTDGLANDQKGLWLHDLKHIKLSEIKGLLAGHSLRLLYLPHGLESKFRDYFCLNSANWLRKSVYGLIILYLLVVVPVGLFFEDASKPIWMWLAVAPIGVVLFCIWLLTLIKEPERYVELVLEAGVFICLTGTLSGVMLLGEHYLGQVAALESIYIIMVAFSVLKLRTMLALVGCLTAIAVASWAAWLVDTQYSALTMLLCFWIPLLICAFNGYMLEHAYRRDFVQMLCHHHEKSNLLQEMIAIGNEAKDVQAVLEYGLNRICVHMGWHLGRAYNVEQQNLGPVAASGMGGGLKLEWLRTIEHNWPEARHSELAQEAMQLGKPSWAKQGIELGEDATSTRLAFPVMIDNEVAAVLEFFSPRDERLAPNMLALMEQATNQLGRLYERDRQQQMLTRVSLEDPLTGLPNRVAFLNQLHAALSRHRRTPNYHFAVMCVGVGRFKSINESLGHASGDEVLREVARRLQMHHRPTDVIARINGAEFAILMDNIYFPEDVMALIKRIQEKFVEPVQLDGQSLNLDTSIGVAYSGQGLDVAEEILSDADTAMSQAKDTNVGYLIFEEMMRHRVQHRLRLTEDLKKAIETDQLELFYQPIVDLQSGQVSGFESLIRWNHPRLGMVSPNDFIPLAEDTQLILPLTVWVVHAAARQLQSWQEINPETMLSVNLCASYFASGSMPDEMIQIIEQHDLRRGSFRLEITETKMIDNEEACLRNLRRLAKNDIPVYIDDFGTGYSSLHYLANYQVSALKIDKSFMDRITEQGKDTIVVNMIASLGQNLGLKVIAEGVENEAQLHCLKAIGCDYVQGFLMSRPVPAQEAKRLIGMQLVGVMPESQFGAGA
ncbi:putative bifunctional diguanylate cyclase/phosphodiesterase [Marinobacter sp. SS21]|uniref:putative bifunctional diguanylate cyclase/phosphodiesterase n=1 Tax=Marinobacter sp. SS21 TaxID=2979460 RepID=UPI002330AC69|nr:GGDEF domain-containing protein [Marinobacter sp. SS21]MDC0663642.1 GGDEF domain-containing protein [Marinobacter sp. SS21]